MAADEHPTECSSSYCVHVHRNNSLVHRLVGYLHQGGSVLAFICLLVRLSLSRISQNVKNAECSQNFWIG